MNPEFPNEVVHDVQPATLQTLFSNLLAQVIVVSLAKPPRNIRDALRDLLPFVRFKICEKHHGVLLLVKLNLQLYYK